MKNFIFLFVAALFFTAAVNAQSTADSIHAKYQMQPMPEALTIEKTFPVLGAYQLVSTDGTTGQSVTITLDSTNKGLIWVAGLPEGTFKAYLKKVPGTYKILSQKTESGKQIPEGTLFFDPATNNLNIALGKAYDEADPTAVFALNTAVTSNTNATADVNMSTTVNPGNAVKVKSKSADKDLHTKSKTKNKLVFYTATKNTMNSTSTNAAKQ